MEQNEITPAPAERANQSASVLPERGSATPQPGNDVEANKDLAAFSYIYVMSVVVYLLRGRQSAFIRFHARQAMALFALAVLVWFVPFVGRLLEIIVLFGMVTGFIAAAKGEWKDIPFIGPVVRGKLGLRESWKQAVDGIARLKVRKHPTARTTLPSAPKANEQSALAHEETPSMLIDDEHP
ncbi:MAG: hypothetical protein PHW10_01485 [Candidatus Peribacteraceae bacterium]|nr:hypothetical protein [Candidatus Peribacteraceae bacterium]